MARPKSIKLPNGTVTLSGFSKEETDKLVTSIEALGTEKMFVASSSGISGEPLTIVTNLPFKAIGMIKNKSTLHWEAVVVGYDVSTNQVEIEKIVKLSDSKPVAWAQWRRMVEELKIYEDAK